MKDDTISRAAAIEKVKELCKGCYLSEHCGKCLAKCLVRKAVKILGKVSPAQSGWIPVTERLPEGIGQVIIQTNGGAIHEVFYKGKNDYGHEVWMRLDGDIYWDDEVVAWQPLPTPYREGGQDGKN